MQKIPRPGKIIAVAVMTTVAAASVITFASGSPEPAPVNLADPPSSRIAPTLDAPSSDDEDRNEEAKDDKSSVRSENGDAAQKSSTGRHPSTAGTSQRSTSPTAGSGSTTSPRPTSPAPTRTSSSPTRPAPSTSPQPQPSPSPDRPNLVGGLLDALLGD